jgi:hypothetical protein
MSYSIGIDREITVGDKVYYVTIDADVEFRDWECPEPSEVEITKAEVAPLDGDPLPIEYSGRAIEKVIVTGLPELTEAIDQALWEEIERYDCDNAYEIQRDLRDARDDHYL